MYHGQVPCKGQTTKQGSICSVYTNAGAKGNSSLSNMVNDVSESSLQGTIPLAVGLFWAHLISGDNFVVGNSKISYILVTE